MVRHLGLNGILIGASAIVAFILGSVTLAGIASPRCDAAYPDVCIPSPPPDLNCNDISDRNFQVLPPDPHLDRDHDGIGCERKRQATRP